MRCKVAIICQNEYKKRYNIYFNLSLGIELRQAKEVEGRDE